MSIAEVNEPPGKKAGAPSAPFSVGMKLTDIANPDYFHKVVDCQWACPAHTPVPEYIRMIAAGAIPTPIWSTGIPTCFLGCWAAPADRPCEPACRRGRVEEVTKKGRARRYLPS